ncbi:FAD-binding domain-containing protein [Aspergillus pseudonomiae]|uniref:FAD-binding domain-containing protein n=1 Tax=Aspergillus pseudonomiae TaxID=1506151 RepID=A0A5N6I2U8_9EURO|nr:FAD-binding domain-containing protein [Aspergillus pseudonomiae]KAB8259403.1 FAD-binding domain-containing protein [Aspergillus pseudonomiae]KAE8408324.1 FAD-binding domain-containing protein [Aspergillus pseudonomiae]
MAASGTSAAADPFTTLCSLLRPDEIITPQSPDYEASIQTWAAQKQARPRLAIRPTSVEALAKAISYLYTTSLDFAIYGQGFSSASAKDIVVNTSAFDDFHFDPQAEVVTIGAGQTWSAVYRKLAKAAPQYGIVGARTPCVGVAGTIVSGGYSWLSSEYGCISDAENMLDAKVVKYDGSVVWASTEPDLLWALRGGGGGFGVLAQVKLRVFRYPQNVWAGPILVPRERLEEVAEGIENFIAQPVDPKITMFLYVVKGRLLESIGTDSDMLVIHSFDANGEEHGRKAFRWALDIPGAIDQTKITTLAGVANLQDKAGIVKGTMKQFWQPLLLQEIRKETVTKAIKWFEEVQKVDESFGDCTYLIFELLSSRDPAAGSASSAWPRPKGAKHILLLGTGCPADAGPSKEKLARDLAIEAPSNVLESSTDVHVLPNGIEDYHAPTKIWGPHVAKLQSLRVRYDPRRRFKGAVNP